MELNDFILKKRELESNIGSEINKLIYNFYLETGETPIGISIGMIDVATRGDAKCRYVLGPVKVEFGI